MNGYYQLVNKKGEKTPFLIRRRKTGDEEGMLACIYDEYGDTYFKGDFYNTRYLQREADDGRISFIVAENVCTGEIAGMMSLKTFYPKDEMCEIASQIIKKEYRGYGLAMPLFEYGMRLLQEKQYTSAYCLPVMFHDVTQRLMKRFDLVATGLIMNVFDVENMIHSYDNGRNIKHSQGIQVRRHTKTDAGILYLPAEHIRFCKGIYDALGVTYKVAPQGTRLPDSDTGIITYEQDERQQSLEIRVCTVSRDMADTLDRLLQRYPLKGKQTANIFLNINDKGAVWAYNRLRERGWFFTGLRPLGGNREYMVLHNSGDIKIFLEDYHVSKEFEFITDYVKQNGGVKNGR